MTLRHALFTAVALSSFPALAHSTIVTFNFVGQVNRIEDPSGFVHPPIVLGAPVTVSLRYDTSAQDTFPEDETYGLYMDTPGWLKLNIAGVAFEKADTIRLDIFHDFFGKEAFQAMAFGNPTAWPTSPPQLTHPIIVMSFEETGPPLDLLVSDLPPASLDTSRAGARGLSITASTPNETFYVIQFSVTQVPEPGTAGLLLAGGAGLLVRRRSRQG